MCDGIFTPNFQLVGNNQLFHQFSLDNVANYDFFHEDYEILDNRMKFLQTSSLSFRIID
jgi:hypothetical protein